MSQLSVYLGRHRRGTKLSILLKTPSAPDATPIVGYYLNGITLVKTTRLPQKSANFFADDVFLDSDFEDGTYVAVIRYDIASVRQPQQFHYFEVRGGDATGHAIAIHEMRRPLGRAVVTVNEDGTAHIGYNPRLA